MTQGKTMTTQGDTKKQDNLTKQQQGHDPIWAVKLICDISPCF